MERVTFVIERTGSRISCLLNPEALEARRTAGVVRRRDAGGSVLGNPRSDDPLIATGGGITEYDLQLLFDVEIANERTPLPPALAPPSRPEGDMLALADPLAPLADTAPPPTPSTPFPDRAPPVPSVVDVRTLTQPLWALAETGDPVDGVFAPQRVRFIWGKSWNVPGVILAVTQRLERFDANGVPQRSWLSLRLRRVAEEVEVGTPPREPTTPQFEIDSSAPAVDEDVDTMPIQIDPDGYAVIRYDHVGDDRYGDPLLGRAAFEFSGFDDLLRFAEGQRLRLPPRATLTVDA